MQLGRAARHCLGPLLALLTAPVVSSAAPEFQLTFDAKTGPGSFTGRAYVLLNKEQPSALPSSPNWFRTEPFFAQDVKGWKAGTPLTLTAASAQGFPLAFAKLPPATYWATAVLDLDQGARSFSAAEGNVYSRPVRVQLGGEFDTKIALHLDQVYHERPFPQSDRLKLAEIESRLLSAFLGRPTRLRAGVVLPPSFARERARRYPVVYEIPGFGGDHWGAVTALKRGAGELPGRECIWVVLDPNCRWGHHVFADSDNNGPCGRALVEELVPYIENTFRGLGTPAGRLVTGHSSGGWSSLWLQVHYPHFFGGVWSTAPDPVDFRDFQRINLYAPGANVFTDADGRPRPVARIKDKAVLWYKPFSDMEAVMGHGGQLGSFEAVFGPRGPGGRPAPLWNRMTGQVDPAVVRLWKRYDIRMVVENNWPQLAPKLAGKLHVYMGDADTFYLEGATRLLKAAFKRLGSDAVVELFRGRNHATLVDAALRERMQREMAARLRGLAAEPVLPRR